jgi:hypothetical protein
VIASCASRFSASGFPAFRILIFFYQYFTALLAHFTRILFPFFIICATLFSLSHQAGNGPAESEAVMDDATAPRKRVRLNPHGKAVRRERIFERLRGGLSYEAVAHEEGVTPRRIRQIVTEALRRQEVDSEADHAMLQLVRLESAHRLAAEAVAAGDIGAITALLSVLDRLDRYRRGAAPVKAYDKKARELLFAKLDSIARALARMEPKPRAADGGSPDAAVAPEPERSAALPLDSPVNP